MLFKLLPPIFEPIGCKLQEVAGFEIQKYCSQEFAFSLEGLVNLHNNLRNEANI